jgi:hypothetical protein
MERCISLAGFLIAAGLLTQTITLAWANPVAFTVFLVVGAPLVAAGAILYLYSLVRSGER